MEEGEEEGEEGGRRRGPEAPNAQHAVVTRHKPGVSIQPTTFAQRVMVRK